MIQKNIYQQKAVNESGIKIIPAKYCNNEYLNYQLEKQQLLQKICISNEAIMAFHDKHIVEIIPEYIFYLL